MRGCRRGRRVHIDVGIFCWGGRAAGGRSPSLTCSMEPWYSRFQPLLHAVWNRGTADFNCIHVLEVYGLCKPSSDNYINNYRLPNNRYSILLSSLMAVLISMCKPLQTKIGPRHSLQSFRRLPCYNQHWSFFFLAAILSPKGFVLIGGGIFPPPLHR